jgi:hypothetical protein
LAPGFLQQLLDSLSSWHFPEPCPWAKLLDLLQQGTNEPRRTSLLVLLQSGPLRIGTYQAMRCSHSYSGTGWLLRVSGLLPQGLDISPLLAARLDARVEVPALFRAHACGVPA